MYVCSLFDLPFSVASMRDGRPHISGKVEDVDTDFSVDTGAYVTVISETLFRRLPNHWKLPQVEVSTGFRLSAVSGHHMQLLGCFQITLKVLGHYVNRPIYVLSGLAKPHAILGMDFVREQQLCIEADDMFFKKFPLEESVSCLTLTPPEDFSVSPRTVLRTKLFVWTARETLLLPGTSGVSSRYHLEK